MEKKVYVLWEGQRETVEDNLPGHCEIVCAFNTEDELIKYIKNIVRDQFEIFGGEYFRMPSKDEFGPRRDIYFAHDYGRHIEHYFRYEVCELK